MVIHEHAEPLDRGSFDELASDGRAFDGRDLDQRIREIGYGMRSEVEMGACWPTCGCEQRYACCPDVRVAKCGDQCAFVMDRDGLAPVGSVS